MKAFTISIIIISLLLTAGGCGKEEKTVQKQDRQNAEVDPASCNMDSLMAIEARLVMSPEDTLTAFGIADCTADKAATPFDKALVELGRGEYGKAEKALAEALKESKDIAPVTARLYFYMGIALYLNIDTLGAREAFDSSLAYYEKAPEVLTSRGITQYDLGYYNKAVDDFDSAIAIRHDYGEAWYHRANSYYMMAQFKDALFSYDSAIVYQCDMIKAWYNKAATLHRLGRLEEALVGFDSVLAHKHDDYMAWSGRGLILSRWEKTEEAIACFDSSLAYNSNNPNTWNNKAAALAVLKKFDEALACIDSSLMYVPDNDRTTQLQTLIIRESGQITE